MALVYIDDAHFELLRLMARLEEAGEGELTERAIEALVRQRAAEPDGPLGGAGVDGLEGLGAAGGALGRLRDGLPVHGELAGVR